MCVHGRKRSANTTHLILPLLCAGERAGKAESYGRIFSRLDLGGGPFLSQKIQSSVLRVGKWHFPTAQNPIGQIFPRIPAELLENRPIFQSGSGWKIAVGKWGGHKPILPETRNCTVCCPNKGQYREVMHKPSAGIKTQGVLRPVGRTRAANVIPAALHC